MNLLWGGEILPHMPTGGVARYCAELIRALDDTCRQLVWCPPGAPPYPVSGSHLAQVSETPIGLLNRFRLQRFAPQIFQSGYYGTSPVPGLPTVQIAYDFIDARYPAVLGNKVGFVDRQRDILNRADAVICISEATRQDVLTYTSVPDDRTVVVYPVVPSFVRAEPTTAESPSASRPYLLWVGPRAGYKNFATFLKAYVQVAQARDLDLVLVGNKGRALSEGELSLLIQHRLLDRVRILPPVPDSDLQGLYRNALALVQSSIWEGFGIPLVEALLCGTQLVVSDIPVFHEVAGDHATYVDPFDPEAWVAALEALSPQSPDAAVLDTLRHQLLGRLNPGTQIKDLRAVYAGLLGA